MKKKKPKRKMDNNLFKFAIVSLILVVILFVILQVIQQGNDLAGKAVEISSSSGGSGTFQLVGASEKEFTQDFRVAVLMVNGGGFTGTLPPQTQMVWAFDSIKETVEAAKPITLNIEYFGWMFSSSNTWTATFSGISKIEEGIRLFDSMVGYHNYDLVVVYSLTGDTTPTFSSVGKGLFRTDDGLLKFAVIYTTRELDNEFAAEVANEINERSLVGIGFGEATGVTTGSERWQLEGFNRSGNPLNIDPNTTTLRDIFNQIPESSPRTESADAIIRVGAEGQSRRAGTPVEGTLKIELGGEMTVTSQPFTAWLYGSDGKIKTRVDLVKEKYHYIEGICVRSPELCPHVGVRAVFYDYETVYKENFYMGYRPLFEKREKRTVKSIDTTEIGSQITSSFVQTIQRNLPTLGDQPDKFIHRYSVSIDTASDNQDLRIWSISDIDGGIKTFARAQYLFAVNSDLKLNNRIPLDGEITYYNYDGSTGITMLTRYFKIGNICEYDEQGNMKSSTPAPISVKMIREFDETGLIVSSEDLDPIKIQDRNRCLNPFTPPSGPTAAVVGITGAVESGSQSQDDISTDTGEIDDSLERIEDKEAHEADSFELSVRVETLIYKIQTEGLTPENYEALLELLQEPLDNNAIDSIVSMMRYASIPVNSDDVILTTIGILSQLANKEGLDNHAIGIIADSLGSIIADRGGILTESDDKIEDIILGAIGILSRFSEREDLDTETMSLILRGLNGWGNQFSKSLDIQGVMDVWASFYDTWFHFLKRVSERGDIDNPTISRIFQGLHGLERLPFTAKSLKQLAETNLQFINRILEREDIDSSAIKEITKTVMYKSSEWSVDAYGVAHPPEKVEYGAIFSPEEVDGMIRRWGYDRIVGAIDDENREFIASVFLPRLSDTSREALGLGITWLNRFDSQTLETLIQNRQNIPTRSDKLAIVVYPTADWNGGFENIIAIEQLIENGYTVYYYEASTETEVYDALRDAGGWDGQEFNRPADVIIFGGHGSQQSLALGAPDPAKTELQSESYYLDTNDEQELRDLGGSLNPDGQIILKSCSTGEGRESGNNLANTLRRSFPQARRQGIHSPTVPTNIETLEFENGILKRVIYSPPGEIAPNEDGATQEREGDLYYRAQAPSQSLCAYG